MGKANEFTLREQRKWPKSQKQKFRTEYSCGSLNSKVPSSEHKWRMDATISRLDPLMDDTEVRVNIILILQLTFFSLT